MHAKYTWHLSSTVHNSTRMCIEFMTRFTQRHTVCVFYYYSTLCARIIFFFFFHFRPERIAKRCWEKSHWSVASVVFFSFFICNAFLHHDYDYICATSIQFSAQFFICFEVDFAFRIVQCKKNIHAQNKRLLCSIQIKPYLIKYIHYFQLSNPMSIENWY